jgi:cobalamin biosynthesis Mg chelatase CobN
MMKPQQSFIQLSIFSLIYLWNMSVSLSTAFSPMSSFISTPKTHLKQSQFATSATTIFSSSMLTKVSINLHKDNIRTTLQLQAATKDEEEDDGWGENDNTTSATNTSSSSTKNSETVSKERELSTLRSQIEAKSNPSSNNVNSNSSVNNASEERDLFIPIFAVISLAGLFGAYGYEMFRLYSRGELYLPGM